ncbi:tol-pal system protein YbgF [Kushneria phosphatilytica]|uniref:Cell division coordinator CpoB n=1 Tax=Kushneria phosphatilytica TaxID=657387 RepID=A0A1S1NRQ5_9GAMM|nr:tol-pal system protein YbgF [Kushneria phosphatilytica]OHV11944.1 tol-pal system protein YbgF [Kushneria phosphatilytica]QEL11125.1 tol-pal system protein YbgF [Kushneria phosphatilytica]
MKHSLIRLCGAGALVLPLSVMAESGTDFSAQSNSIYDQTSTGGGTMMLFNRLQDQQQAINELRGRIEKLEHDLAQQTQLSKQRYLDLEERISSSKGTAGGAGNDENDSTSNDPITRAAQSGAGNVPTSSGDSSNASAGDNNKDAREAYQDAFALVQQRQFDQAIDAFEKFNQQYSDTPLKGNAYYWLGELYSAKSQLDKSARAFQTVIDDYPKSSKVSDAIYKLGLVRARQGESDQAQKLLQRVIKEYPDSNAAGLAQDFLDKTSG